MRPESGASAAAGQSPPDGKSTRAGQIRQLAGPTLAERHERLAALDAQMVRCIYQGRPVDNGPLLIHMLRRHASFNVTRGWLEASGQVPREQLVDGLVRQWLYLPQRLPEELLARLVARSALTASILASCPWLFPQAAKETKNVAWLRPLLNAMDPVCRHNLLSKIDEVDPGLSQLLESPEQKIERHPGYIESMPPDQVTARMYRQAVARDCSLLLRLAHRVDVAEYEVLCDLALSSTGAALEYMAPEFRTRARVDRALAHASVPHIDAIPQCWRTRERLRLALEKASKSAYWAHPLSTALLDEWSLWQTLKQKPHWLEFLAERERTDALCREYLRHFPSELFRAVPMEVRLRHPDWEHNYWQEPARLTLESQRMLSWRLGEEPMRRMVQSGGQSLSQIPCERRAAMPPWCAVMAAQSEQESCLSSAHKALILARGGDPGGLGVTFQVPPVSVITANALLDPVQEACCSRRAVALPALVRRHLMFCRPFQLRREDSGRQLRQQMDECQQNLAASLVNETLPLWQSAPGTDWHRRGGRTLVRAGLNGARIHIKLQRQGESLASFAAEEAAQRFARTQPDPGWCSEIPVPEGFSMIPLGQLPVARTDSMDALSLHDYRNCPCYLAFRFTTRDDSYDTPAFEADAYGGRARAVQGLLSALHDLGIWSSMGAVHTSTVRLYHQFQDRDARAELLLTAFFNPREGYPGTLHLWNTRAIELSDWGWSGLRDLGDLEFYPFITTYVEAIDAQWSLPGFAQRGSFLNGIAQNILASLLHYMRLWRTHPDYHYRNAWAVGSLARFVDQGVNRLLDGLLGDGTRLQDMFMQLVQAPGGRDVYNEWLQLTAREMIYWTARQEPGDDCFSEHLNSDGRPSAMLYPGHPRIDVRYGLQADFTEAAGESLGSENGKLPLFYLVRGLYVLAAGLASRLARAQVPDADARAGGGMEPVRRESAAAGRLPAPTQERLS